jgi:P27 family predicted phage terminase small subunit
MAKKKKQPERPEPPEDIRDEALAEWNRICAAVEGMGREIKPADRSILVLHCRTWQINRDVYEHVQKFGSIIKWQNGMPGESPQAKKFDATLKLLRGTLADLGCLPSARDFDVVSEAKAPEPIELEF